MKLEWKKQEKALYDPPAEPVLVTVPPLNYFAVNGRGNPNDEAFQRYVEALYALAYAVKMSPKSGNAPQGYQDYAVYPLEGVWDISEKAKAANSRILDKDELVFTLMIRQPAFVERSYALETIGRVKGKKDLPLLDSVEFITLIEGPCVQMLHRGSYDGESASFAQMEEFCRRNGLRRMLKTHREIYLSDARKTSPERLKTILRFQVSTPA